MQPTRLHLIVEGFVQGVGFRYFVQEWAARLLLTGWVRNVISTGDVEIIAEGEKSQLEKLLNIIQVGPPSAHVISVREEWLTATGEFHTFNIVQSQK